MLVDSLSVAGLSYRYNSSEVLSNVSFHLREGDFLGLVGPNGSGKTTLIRLVLGLLKPTKGSILLFGQEPFRFKDWSRVGYLPQNIQGFNPHFPATVREIVSLGLLSRRSFPKRIGSADEATIDRALAVMGVLAIKGELIGELSGGQLQRVLLAKAMVCDPEILILDEPTTALDPETRDRFFAILRELNEKRRVTIIIITHDIGTIGKYASKLLYLDKGVIFCGSFESFCASEDMSGYFGKFSQHIICHRHGENLS
jgi:zinc transport system ATP-binding protein